MEHSTDPALDAAQFQARMRFAEMAAKRGDVKATCRRLFAAGVIINLDDCKTVTANQVAILQSQLKEMRAEHQQAQNRLTKQIQELLAIDNEVQE